MTPKRKLIEVALPLEAINRESAREKSIRHGHPSTLHLWWARRPLAAARAVLFAQLVDDPSSHPEEFPTDADQKRERERLHEIIERLVVWENIRDEGLLKEARAEIAKSTGGKPPPILDPFCGGGTIPLEAQRLGLDAHASDLNPVAVLITKALVEIPPKFHGRPPVFPGLAATRIAWSGAEGLAADVRAYGKWVRDEAERRIGHLYPKATLPDGSNATVIAWIWARTVTCPNPACRATAPLLNSFAVANRSRKQVWLQPNADLQGGRVRFDVMTGAGWPREGSVSRSGARCLVCGAAIPLSYVRSEGKAGQMARQLVAVVGEGTGTRIYLPATEDQERCAEVPRPDGVPTTDLPQQALGFRVQGYGITHHADLFTNRQLTLLVTLAGLLDEARQRCVIDSGDPAYAQGVATYLALWVSKVTNRSSSQSFWDATREGVQQVFARNALPMIWVYAEANPFSDSSGNIAGQLDYLVEALEALPAGTSAVATQADAMRLEADQRFCICTDPPYYDNVPYGDLSDFFYVWLRQVLLRHYPELFRTVLVPKGDELIAEPARQGSWELAARFFESGLRLSFDRLRAVQRADLPYTVFYAFKQAEESADGVVSTGWDTMLQALLDSGAEIVATWPIRTEQAGGLREFGRNALASSIVLALRARPEDAPTTDRRGFLSALHAELPRALRELQQGAIAPVDLPQAAIGPGMAVFSRYATVIESDGSAMTVRAALARINEILDQVLNEEEGDFDSTTRWAIAWYRQHGYTTGTFGDADNLARARNTAVDAMARDGIVTSHAGKVALLPPAGLADEYDVVADERTGAWEVLHHLIRIVGNESEGIPGAGRFLGAALSRPDGAVDVGLVKELAFLLFSIAERNGWTRDALSFNALATSWPEIVQASRHGATISPEPTFDFDEEA